MSKLKRKKENVHVTYVKSKRDFLSLYKIAKITSVILLKDLKEDITEYTPRL